MIALLLVSLGMAQAGTLKLDGNAHDKTFACEGQAVTLEGNRLAVTLTGDCGLVKVVGNDNTVDADGVSKVELVGNHNTLAYSRNLSGKKKLPTSKMGVGNKVKTP